MTCGRSVVFSGSSSFLHQKSWPLRYQWNIAESCVKHHQNKQTNPLKSYWTQTFKNMGVGDVGILQAGHFLMDPLKEAAWKSDFKFKTKGVFLTLVPLATLDILYLVKFVWHTLVHNFTGNKTLPKTLETKDEILNKRYRKPEGTTTWTRCLLSW